MLMLSPEGLLVYYTFSPIIPAGMVASLTFDIPQGEVSIVDCFRGQFEEEAMSRLQLVSVHRADVVNYLEEIERKQRLDCLLRSPQWEQENEYKKCFAFQMPLFP